MTTGEKVSKLRKKRSWSQSQLARVTGLSRSYISAIEQGRGHPSIKALAIIAEALGVDVDQLKGGG